MGETNPKQELVLADKLFTHFGTGFMIQLTLKNVQAFIDLMNGDVFYPYYDGTKACYGHNYTYISIQWNIGDKYKSLAANIGDFVLIRNDGIEILTEPQAERKLDFMYDISNVLSEDECGNKYAFYTKPVVEIIDAIKQEEKTND